MNSTRFAINAGLVALALVLLAGFIFGKRRSDMTEIILTWLTACAVILRALFGFVQLDAEASRSLAQARYFGLASGVAVGLGIALVTHVLVRRYPKRNEVQP